MTRILRGLMLPIAALGGATCAGCRVVPVERRGATCSPACWLRRSR